MQEIHPETFPEAAPGAEPAPPAQTPPSLIREWADALVIAFLLAMFIRTFVVELYKIPSGSMTPTLVGTAFDDRNRPVEYEIQMDVSTPRDGEKDLILDRPGYRSPRYDVWYRKNGEFVANEERDNLDLSPAEAEEARRLARPRNDRILVSKFLYWFTFPRRGDIVVFRVPEHIYERDKPIYVKRVVGLPGEHVEIREPHVYINGERLQEPPVFQRNHYTNYGMYDNVRVPKRAYFVLGDNSKSSRDSRAWGMVPENHIKGKAVFRYWPLDGFGFLK
ncbi:MAG: signal peptidase I [Candidatus Sumerlaeia bacterium]|nr:signal peptidase I [Candidatus Sumerlaeia bacterium]